LNSNWGFKAIKRKKNKTEIRKGKRKQKEDGRVGPNSLPVAHFQLHCAA
jgi:hypothetical protein